jgi:hypothetical protein
VAVRYRSGATWRRPGVSSPGLDAATAFAARIPAARFGGTVEVRPMLER